LVGALYAAGKQPKEPRHRTLLAAARYRCGQLEQALALLAPDPLELPSDSMDLAFTALCAHALGRSDLARRAADALAERLQTLDPELKVPLAALAREVDQTLAP
jgi:hypothetical protein